MAEESAAPTTRRVELADEQWVELRIKRIVADARYQREQRHARGGYDDETLDELALIEARVVSWSFGEVPQDMNLRRIIIDNLDEDDAIKLVLANRGVDADPKDLLTSSPDSSTGTPRRGRKAKAIQNSLPVEDPVPTSG